MMIQYLFLEHAIDFNFCDYSFDWDLYIFKTDWDNKEKGCLIYKDISIYFSENGRKDLTFR